jgi:hypothetical protein
MRTIEDGFFAGRLCRTVLLVAAIVVGALVTRGANATIRGEGAYSERLVVPPFVADVRELIVDAAFARGWKLVNEGPGELTFELQHARSHMDVVVRSFYSKSEISFRKVSAKTFECVSDQPCEVNPDVVQRWMINLRREVGVTLLRLAIKDAGGTLPAGREAVAEAE